MIKKINIIIFLIVFAFCSISLTSCKRVKEPECQHVDKDDNSLCDKCNEAFEDGKDKVTAGLVDKISLEELYVLIDNTIPKEVTEDIRLPRGFSESLAFIYWYSSNEDAITNGGKVTRTYEDVEVTFRVEIKYSETEIYEREVKTVVKGIKLKPITNKKLVFAYLYASDGYTGINEESLEYVDYINYSFGGVSNGLAVVNKNAALEKVLSYRTKGVRVGLALGGWGSGGFSEAVRTPESRTKFAQSIVNLLRKYQFDGVDIDWEYPGSSVAGIDSHPSDTINLTLFCQELYPMIKSYRSDALLTMAVAATTSFDFRGLKDCVDYFNLMTYDHSIGDSSAYHHTSLYSGVYAKTSVDSAVTKLINWGAPANKIIIGAAFYGRTAAFANNDQLKLGGKLITTLSNTYSYSKIEEGIRNGTYVEMFDEEAQANYIIMDIPNSTGRFITYDGIQSITAKCNYVKTKNLAGIMFWEYTQDKNGTLVLTIHNEFNKEKD